MTVVTDSVASLDISCVCFGFEQMLLLPYLIYLICSVDVQQFPAL